MAGEFGGTEADSLRSAYDRDPRPARNPLGLPRPERRLRGTGGCWPKGDAISATKATAMFRRICVSSADSGLYLSRGPLSHIRAEEIPPPAGSRCGNGAFGELQDGRSAAAPRHALIIHKADSRPPNYRLLRAVRRLTLSPAQRLALRSARAFVLDVRYQGE